MHCPKCKGFHLKPKKLERGLMAHVCDNCKGSLLSVIKYLQWPIPEQLDAEIVLTENLDNHEACGLLQCPKCSGLMTKHKISVVKNNKLNMCTSCYVVWLDSGEWQFLKQLDIQNKLPEIFTTSWQQDIRSENGICKSL